MEYGDCNYQLTQFLSGHGGYRKYLHRFGHDSSPFCPVCVAEEETAEHVVFKCPRFHQGQDPRPENVIEYIRENENQWSNFNERVSEIHTELRRLEKIRKLSVGNISD